MWEVYDTLLAHLPGEGVVETLCASSLWTMAAWEDHLGLAMTTFGDTRPPLLSQEQPLRVRQAAEAVKSWNLPEASAGMAVINGCYNTPARLEALRCAEPFENYCTRGLDITGKTIGVIGHLGMPKDILRLAGEVYILERNPRPGDYPDSACEYLLPKCDVVLITGSAFVNKTLPRLLELSRRAYTIVTGPSVPMCPELLGLGIQRLAGLVVTDRAGATVHVEQGRSGNPYPFGTPFLLEEDCL